MVNINKEKKTTGIRRGDVDEASVGKYWAPQTQPQRRSEEKGEGRYFKIMITLRTLLSLLLPPKREQRVAELHYITFPFLQYTSPPSSSLPPPLPPSSRPPDSLPPPQKMLCNTFNSLTLLLLPLVSIERPARGRKILYNLLSLTFSPPAPPPRSPLLV